MESDKWLSRQGTCASMSQGLAQKTEGLTLTKNRAVCLEARLGKLFPSSPSRGYGQNPFKSILTGVLMMAV